MNYIILLLTYIADVFAAVVVMAIAAIIYNISLYVTSKVVNNI